MLMIQSQRSHGQILCRLQQTTKDRSKARGFSSHALFAWIPGWVVGNIVIAYLKLSFQNL